MQLVGGYSQFNIINFYHTVKIASTSFIVFAIYIITTDARLCFEQLRN